MNLNQVKKLMDRRKNSHKGENGSVLLIGGSEQFVGALALAGLASLRAGCDLVTVAAEDKVAWTVNKYAPDLISYKIKGNAFTVKNAKEMVKYADRFDAVALGMGMTKKGEKFVNYFVKKSQKPKVVDADALKTMSFKDFQNSVLTPNENELEMLLINSNKDFLLPKLRESNAKEKAEILQGNLRYFLQNNNVLLIKGATDIIISKNKISYNRTGNQGMTKGGTGDVLAGLVTGFLAKTGDLFKSAAAGAFINGFVADLLLKDKKGYCFIASDIIEDLEKIQKIEARLKKSGSTKEENKYEPKSESTVKKSTLKNTKKRISTKSSVKSSIKNSLKIPAIKKGDAKKSSTKVSKRIQGKKNGSKKR